MPALAIPPGPSALSFENLRHVSRDIIGFLQKCQKDYGDFFTMRIGPVRRFVLLDPPLIEQMLLRTNKGFIKPYLLRSTRLLGNGLLSSSGEVWVRQRRMAQPSFHHEAIESYATLMMEHTDRMLASWKDAETRDLHADMRRVTLEIITQTIFGGDITQNSSEAVEAFNIAFEHFGERLKSPFPVPDSVPTPNNLRLRKACKLLDKILFRYIDERKAAGDQQPKDMLGMLLLARDENDRPMPTLQLRDEVTSLVSAGHDASALILTWAFYLLSQHPEAEARMMEEIRTVLGGRRPDAKDTPRLEYTGWIINETMRLYPPVWLFGREAIEDTPLGPYMVPKGTTVLISQYLLHRDGRTFAEPDSFRPERWGEERVKNRHRFSYIPFGGGPRKCLGDDMAMMEAVLMLARIYQRFHLELEPGHPVSLSPMLTLHPRHGMRMKLSQRPAVSA
jgi:cytochrome P450